MSMFKEGSRLERPFLASSHKKAEKSEAAFFESISDDLMLESIEKAATFNERMAAGAACIQWVKGGESSFDTLDSLLYGMAGGRDDVELTPYQTAMYESIQTHSHEFLRSIGNVENHALQDMIDGDEEITDKIFESISSALDAADTDEVLAEFGVRESMMLEAKEKVIRDGKVVVVNKKRRKRRMSAAQKAALKKARAKAHTSAAKAARKKSNRLRQTHGL